MRRLSGPARPRTRRAHHCEAGFGLPEVLVAVLVVALGVVGALRLLSQGLRDTRSALWRSQAATLAADLAERMRANAAVADRYDPARYPDGPADQGCDAARACTASQVAEDELARWLAEIDTLLPHRPGGAPRAEVALGAASPVGPRGARVTVRWNDPSLAAPASIFVDAALSATRISP